MVSHTSPLVQVLDAVEHATADPDGDPLTISCSDAGLSVDDGSSVPLAVKVTGPTTGSAGGAPVKTTVGIGRNSDGHHRAVHRVARVVVSSTTRSYECPATSAAVSNPPEQLRSVPAGAVDRVTRGHAVDLQDQGHRSVRTAGVEVALAGDVQ